MQCTECRTTPPNEMYKFCVAETIQQIYTCENVGRIVGGMKHILSICYQLYRTSQMCPWATSSLCVARNWQKSKMVDFKCHCLSIQLHATTMYLLNNFKDHASTDKFSFPLVSLSRFITSAFTLFCSDNMRLCILFALSAPSVAQKKRTSVTCCNQ